jgi:hypothetical protein
MYVYKNGHLMVDVDECGVEFVDICGILTNHKDTCLVGDINRDSIDEIVLYTWTGGGSCCDGAQVYALEDSIKLIFKMPSGKAMLFIKDINGDSVPELITHDQNWLFWEDEADGGKYAYYAFQPQLIWQWDGRKYRLSNYKYKDYLMKEFTGYSGASVDDSIRISYNCESISTWYFMIYGYYLGIGDLADSAFYKCWPGDDSTKQAKYNVFKEKLISGPYWKELQESNW